MAEFQLLVRLRPVPPVTARSSLKLVVVAGETADREEGREEDEGEGDGGGDGGEATGELSGATDPVVVFVGDADADLGGGGGSGGGGGADG